jgi:uncharacterized protein (DUF4213/DUF364 family)
MIIEQTYNLLKTRYKKQIEKLIIADVRIGIYLTAVRLSDNSTGTSATLAYDQPFCAKSNRDFGDFTPLKIRGQKVLDILESKKESGILSSLRIAVLNAISSKIISSGTYRIIEDLDPLQLVDLASRKTITIVGAFHSYIRKISDTTNKLYVLERNEEALTAEYKKFFITAEAYKTILPVSDIVIITGQTLVNKTIDDLLLAISPGSQVIVTGPSGSIIPDILFENKVSIIGASIITKPELLFDIVSDGGTGFHLFEYCARKICILKDDQPQVN